MRVTSLFPVVTGMGLRICVVIGFLTSCSPFVYLAEQDVEEEFTHVAECTTKELRKPFPGLTFAGMGGRLDHSNGTHYNDLVFQYSKRLDRHTGTVLIKNIIDAYVKRVNSSRALKKYLSDHEFQHRHLSVSVMYLSPTGEFDVHPEICTVRYGKGKITFCTWKVNGHGYEQKEEHDYEEALREFGS